MSQSFYSRAERGDVGGMTVGSLDRVAEAWARVSTWMSATAENWEIDSPTLPTPYWWIWSSAAGWLVELEFGFNVYGERGSVDILAWHAATRTLLIVEVKSRFADLQAMLLSLARKVRLVPGVARDELHWDAAAVGRIVVTYASHGNRSVLAKHSSMFDAALPARSVGIRIWLRAPSGPLVGVWLVSPETVRSRRTE